jgi:transcription elongation factor Elf1
MGATEDYIFVCPECGESMEVNGSMKDALVENGCVVCGSPIGQTAFEVARDSAGR